MDLQYGFDYCKRVGYYYWSKSPSENRGVITIDDWSQDLALHLLRKVNMYDHSRSWKKWVHTIIVNKAITLLTKQWDLKHGLGFSSSVRSSVYIIIEGEVELITSITPELECIIYQSMTKKVKQKKEDHRMDVTYTRVEELCEQFSLPFDKETDETALQSLVGVLSFTLNEMSDDDFKALSESDRLELAQLGEAVEQNKVTLKKTKTKGGPGTGGAGTGGPKGRGIIKRIHELFAEGTQTVSEIVAVMDQEGTVFSPATVRTQVGVLRRKAGLTRQSKAEGKVTDADADASGGTTTEKAEDMAKEKADGDAKKKADADAAAKKKADTAAAAKKKAGTKTAKPKFKQKGKGKDKK